MIKITNVYGQPYSTIDLSNKATSMDVIRQFKETISNSVNSRFYCIYSLGEIMLINTAMLNALFDSGVLDSFRKLIDKQ